MTDHTNAPGQVPQASPPASYRGVPPRVGARGEPPLELAGEDACGTTSATRCGRGRPRSLTAGSWGGSGLFDAADQFGEAAVFAERVGVFAEVADDLEHALLRRGMQDETARRATGEEPFAGEP